MTNFQNFALKTDAGSATWVFKPLLETRKINNVCIYVCGTPPGISTHLES